MDYNRSDGIDLHIHSTYSDGSLTPSEILKRAHELSLSAISITDHDTVEGNRALLLLSLPENLEFVTGVEISAKPPSVYNLSGSIHILGYGIDIENKKLNKQLELLKESRENRIPKIVDRLIHNGIRITLDEVTDYVGNAIAGRPHVAKILVQKGYASSVNEAFNKYLVKGKPAYVKKSQLPVDTVIETICGAGGVPVLAHPGLINLEIPKRNELIRDLKAKGLEGVEVYYPQHSDTVIKELIDIADSLKLTTTGGSDFHGDITPDVEMGRGNGNLFVPNTVYQHLTSIIREKKK